MGRLDPAANRDTLAAVERLKATTMQFKLSSLFTFTAIAATLSAGASLFVRHWDLKSYYIGFYGSGDIPAWVRGTGADGLSESLGVFMGAVWHLGPWILLFGVAALFGAWGLQMRGTTR